MVVFRGSWSLAAPPDFVVLWSLRVLRLLVGSTLSLSPALMAERVLSFFWDQFCTNRRLVNDLTS